MNLALVEKKNDLHRPYICFTFQLKEVYKVTEFINCSQSKFHTEKTINWETCTVRKLSQAFKTQKHSQRV